ncbi:outer membrane protein transport protein, partial [Thermodesulfobacteriota bacterium]
EIDAQLFIVPIAGKMETMIFYGPRQVTLGWAWRPCERFLGSLDLTWLQWSKFNDATMAMAVKFGQGELQVPFVDVLNPNFSDTWLPRAGVEYRLKTWDGLSWTKSAEVRVRGGYYFVDSPVPEQKGVTNYMDSDSHVFSTGLGCALKSPFGSNRTFMMNLHFQLNHLADRKHKKDAELIDLDGDGSFETRVMGYPGYVTGGDIIAGGFTLGVSF